MAANGKAADDGLVSDLAAQVNTSLGNKVPTSRTVNGHALTANVTVTAADVSALPSSATMTINGTAYNLSSNPSVTIAGSNSTVQSVDSSGNVTTPTNQIIQFGPDASKASAGAIFIQVAS